MFFVYDKRVKDILEHLEVQGFRHSSATEYFNHFKKNLYDWISCDFTHGNKDLLVTLAFSLCCWWWRWGIMVVIYS